MAERFVPTLFDRQIVPKLIDVGVDEAAIARLTDDNPRAYFESTPLASLT